MNVISKQLKTIFKGQLPVQKQTSKNIIFARSRSECGMRRLCVTRCWQKLLFTEGSSLYNERIHHFKYKCF